MHYYRNRKNHVNFIYDENPFSNEGVNYFIPSLKESFIEINRTYTYEDPIRLIHEYAHSVSILMNPYQMKYPKKLFSEIEPIFFEMIATDYLRDFISEENIAILNMNRMNDFCYSSIDIHNIINIITAEYESGEIFTKNKQLKKIALEKCNISNQELENLLSYPDLYSGIYLISYILAIELYSKYKDDKEYALHLLKKVILLNESTEEKNYSKIKKLGLTPNKNTIKYQNSIIQEYNTIARKRSKK